MVPADPLRVALAVAGPPVLAEVLVAAGGIDGTAALVLRVLGWAVAVVLTMVVVVRPLVAEVVDARLFGDDLSAELTDQREDRELRTRFERALTQTDGEPAALRCALRAVAELAPEHDASLLLAVPDEPRVGWEVRLSDGELRAAEPVPDTPGCAALAANTTTTTDSSTALDACEHLDDLSMDVSCTCVPLHVGDRLLGVISVLGPPGEVPDRRARRTLEWLVERTGVRITEQRRLRGPAVVGRTDPVTELPGSSALHRHLRDSIRSLTPFCLAMVDLDDFSGLREAHGDTEADSALRLVADTLRLTLRPDDVVCRLEGARFGVVLANCSAAQASAALERVREALVLATTIDEGVPVTFSAGVVESHRAGSIEELAQRARTAADAAHGNGGNRVTISAD